MLAADFLLDGSEAQLARRPNVPQQSESIIVPAAVDQLDTLEPSCDGIGTFHQRGCAALAYSVAHGRLLVAQRLLGLASNDL
jgi:hypothetical protein